MGHHLGYFTHFGLDEQTAAPSVAGYSDAFDTIEVYNGDEAYPRVDPFVYISPIPEPAAFDLRSPGRVVVTRDADVGDGMGSL